MDIRNYLSSNSAKVPVNNCSEINSDGLIKNTCIITLSNVVQFIYKCKYLTVKEILSKVNNNFEPTTIISIIDLCMYIYVCI